MNTREAALREIAAQLPVLPGVYMYKGPDDEILYVGKAKSLRSRVRNYFSDERLADSKTGTLISEAIDITYILVDNEKEALALENNLIKRYKPRFNILLRDDKTYPYVKLTKEKHPRVYVTRRLPKDGSTYFGPYFPGNLAYRVVHFIHKSFRVPSCKVDLTRNHKQPCLEYHIHRCLGPCVEGLTTPAIYDVAVKNVKSFLEGRHRDLAKDLRDRMEAAAEDLRFEEAAGLRDLLTTVEEIEQRQKMDTVDGDDIDIFGWYHELPLVAVNLFHLRRGKIVERREYFWEDRLELDPAEFFASLVKQIYLNELHVPALIHVPAEFEDLELLEEMLTEKRGRTVEILTPKRGQKKAMLELVERNAKHSFDARFRVLKPTSKAIGAAVQENLNLAVPPTRIECFDISHVSGTDKVASMVVWEDGKMKKSDYRKFIIRTVVGNDDFASMKEVVTRRYSKEKLPSLILIDGGLGQLHAAADALEAIGIINQPLASIAKREEWIYVLGQEHEPVILDRYSPVLHLIQTIRDEAHRFAVTFHRTRRNASRLTSELVEVPGIGPRTVNKLLSTLGSLDAVKNAAEADLAKVVGPAAARKIRVHLGGGSDEGAKANPGRSET